MIILDTGATLALAQGHKTLNLLAGNMARTPGDLLRIPALCLMQAESADAGAAGRVLAFSSVVVDHLDTTASVTVGTMIRDGYGGADTCHALYCALPRTEFAGMSILLTDREQHYPPGVVTVDIDSPGMLGFH
ncbi:PIN domain-containing protein [Streptomyces cellulosae]|uniref:PIN domain-containing protein n=1 Tax=Streptomyces cellulosae TaxID=1968 RepID=A0ABW7Y238_STRCE